MKKLIIYIYIICIGLASNLFGQENFPINGVKETDQVFHAFTNAEIYINHTEKIKGATLLIKNDKIIGKPLFVIK